MSFASLLQRSRWLGVIVALLLLPTLVIAAGRRSRKPEPGQFNPKHATVEMFKAIEDGKIDVKLIPKDSSECRVIINNKTDKPLNVKLPEAFAGVPVLAQNANVGGNRGNRNVGGGQGIGGGFGGMGMGAMGMMNVPPEKVGKLKVTTVCLEHGKPEPRPAMKYQIKPIQSFTKKPAVHELCRMLGSGRIDQRAAQVAAWHLGSEMNWEQLAGKRLEFANGTSRPYFTPMELHAGVRIAATATDLAEKRQKSPGELESLSLR